MVLLVIPQLAEHFPYQIGRFMDLYDQIALNLLAGNGYRLHPETSETLLRTPGYVFVLTGIFYLFGYSLAAAQVVNILFGIATAYVIVLIAKRWVMRTSTSLSSDGAVEWAPLVPAMLFLFHPGVIFSETRGGVESLFMLLLTGFVYFLYSSIRTNRVKDFILAGITLGLAMLVKSTPALIPIVFFPYLLLRGESRGMTQTSIIMNFVIMGLAAFIMLAPWGLRNYALTGEFSLTSSVKGTAAHHGLYVNKNFASGKDRDPLLKEANREQASIADQLGLEYRGGRRDSYFKAFYSAKDEIKFDHHLSHLVVDEYMTSPGLFLKSCALNFGGFWFRGKASSSTYLNIGLTAPLLLLACWGIYSGYRRGFDVTPLILVIGAFILPHLPILGVARYHIPLIPFLAILATIPFVRTLGETGDESVRTSGSIKP
jgi:4-amino-4-deoxy-L-arabinose transferase-like glycosyltransferase